MYNQQAARRAVNNKTTFWSMISAVAVAAVMVPVSSSTDGASAKTPGKTYCFNRVCHRVLTLAETRRQIGRKRSVTASFYRSCKVDRFNPCGLTSSGAVYRPNRADNAASPIYPNGTKLLVWNPSNKRAAVVRINNAGPYWGRRTLDLSSAAASRLGFRHRGVARLVVKVIHSPSTREARYRRGRTYAPVKGYIGRHASLASATRASGGRLIRGSSSRLAKATRSKRKLTRVASARKVRRSANSRKRSLRAAVAAEKRSLRRSKRAQRRVASVSRKTRGTRTVAVKSRKRTQRKATASSSNSRVQRTTRTQRRIVRKARTVRNTRPRILKPAAVKKPVVVAGPRKVWRRKYFSPGGAGA